MANYTGELWVIFIYTVIYDLATRKHGDRLVDMKFIKNFNNNAALVTGEFGVEWVVVGNGVGFGKKAGDEVDETKVTHRFIAADKTEALLANIGNVSPETLALTKDVVHLVESRQETTFIDYGYLALIDHIDFALQRAHKGIDMAGSSSDWEVRKLFPQQYRIAKEVVQLMEERTNLTFGNSEAVYLTYHLLNMETDDTDLQDTMRITKIIRAIVDIVQYQFGIQLDQNSFNVDRFVTHLRRFIIRHMKQITDDTDELDSGLLALMKAKYADAYATVEKIAAYLDKTENWQLTSDDKLYLALHIWRVTHRQKQTPS